METIVITGKIDDKMSRWVMEILLKALTQLLDVVFCINSGGGDGDEVRSWMFLMEQLRKAGHPVTTVCVGYAGSAAAMLLAGGAKGHRFIIPDGEVMIHHGVRTNTMRSLKDSSKGHVEREEERYLRMYMFIAGCTKEQALTWLDGKDYFMNAEEALDNGLVDQIGFPAFLVGKEESDDGYDG